MKRSRCSEEQIIGILKEHQAGLGAKDLCRKHGISDATYYKWRSKYGGMEVSLQIRHGYRGPMREDVAASARRRLVIREYERHRVDS